ncbi:uncharacterized protein B0I36DRAFT_329026 [Microdochium trichocladiopsis]|uniref:Uncharacterized protein n=1 Tax=Microdochium trichocladiopsis TaxID=1682393 RepID=A0A9P9BMD6_9PEZI|nr:uncharacterized protein B0I36DRAFT_329026 [Microdochium trichocladiopsis]KAH7025736.1 hypothetical protein B0I36DRAFT_329026 [Microdochium trichocladiopsis]
MAFYYALQWLDIFSITDTPSKMQQRRKAMRCLVCQCPQAISSALRTGCLGYAAQFSPSPSPSTWDGE